MPCLDAYQAGGRVDLERVSLAQAPDIACYCDDADQRAADRQRNVSEADTDNANAERLGAAPAQCRTTRLAASGPGHGALMWNTPQVTAYLAPSVTVMGKRSTSWR